MSNNSLQQAGMEFELSPPVLRSHSTSPLTKKTAQPMGEEFVISLSNNVSPEKGSLRKGN